MASRPIQDVDLIGPPTRTRESYHPRYARSRICTAWYVRDMDTTTLVVLIVVLSLALLCGGAALFLMLAMVLGFIILRRRGRKGVTPREAVSEGVEQVSQVFRRRPDGGLEPATEDDDD